MGGIGEKILTAFIALFTVAVFGLCGIAFWCAFDNESNRITEGVVIDKEYNSAYTTHSHIKSGDVYINVPQFHPENYNILLEGEKDGKTVTYWKRVTAQEYSVYNIGDYYPKKGENDNGWP